MRLLAITLFFASALVAEEAAKPDPRDAEIAHLRAQIAALQIELQIAQFPEVMRARLAVIDSQAALQAAKEAAKPKPEPPKPQAQ